MLNKIFKACGFLFTIVFLASSTLFSAISPAEAAQISSDNNEENALGIVIEESVDSMDGSITNKSPDLGDDQAFPFIPGFGKNSGKD